MNNQLFKSRSNKVFSGVCGGLGEYFKIDPSIVRVAWVLFSIILGAGIGGLIIYIIAALIIPETPSDYSGYSYNPGTSTNYDSEFGDSSNKWAKSMNFDTGKSRIVIGGVLIFVGLLALAKQFFHWLDFSFFWPLVLIGIGGLILYNGRGNKYE